MEDTKFRPNEYIVVSPYWVELYKSTICFLDSLCHVLRGPSIFGDLATQVYKTFHILSTFIPEHKWFCFVMFECYGIYNFLQTVTVIARVTVYCLMQRYTIPRCQVADTSTFLIV